MDGTSSKMQYYEYAVDVWWCTYLFKIVTQAWFPNYNEQEMLIPFSDQHGQLT